MKSESFPSKNEKGEFSLHSLFFRGVSDRAKELIKKMLTVNSHQRINLMDTCNHEWFSKKDEIDNNESRPLMFKNGTNQ